MMAEAWYNVSENTMKGEVMALAASNEVLSYRIDSGVLTVELAQPDITEKEYQQQQMETHTILNYSKR